MNYHQPQRHQRQRLSPQEMADSLERVNASIEGAVQSHYELMNHVFLEDAIHAQVNYSMSLLRRAQGSLKRGVDACGGQN